MAGGSGRIASAVLDRRRAVADAARRAEPPIPPATAGKGPRKMKIILILNGWK